MLKCNVSTAPLPTNRSRIHQLQVIGIPKIPSHTMRDLLTMLGRVLSAELQIDYQLTVLAMVYWRKRDLAPALTLCPMKHQHRPMFRSCVPTRPLFLVTNHCHSKALRFARLKNSTVLRREVGV